MPTDPVCGMFVPETSNLVLEKDGQKFYFCSSSCLEKYKSPEEEEKKLKTRLIVAWSFSVPVILVTYLVSLAGKNFLLLALSLPVQFYSGLGFYSGAYHSIMSKSGNMDLLISLGTLTAFIYSTFITLYPNFIPGPQAYFDASVFIITLILTGSYIENKTKIRANTAASKLIAIIPNIAHLITADGKVKDVKTDQIMPKDKLQIKPGEIISVDGVVYDGVSEVDESAMTGEQEPVVKKTGDGVTSGTKNLNGILKITVERSGKDTTVNKIYELIQRAASGRAKVQRIADVFSNIFVPIVLAAALGSALFWYFYLSSIGYQLAFEIAVLTFVSVVVIACPCAIGLAGPITLLISSNVSSENGLVVKNSSAFDRLSKATRVVFDKTGTLTDPQPIVSGIKIEDGFEDNSVLSMAASLEKFSNHPVAKSVVSLAGERKLNMSDATDFMEIPGQGIIGKVNGSRIAISRSNNSKESSIEVLIDDKRAALITLSYKLRDNSKEAITQLKSNGMKTSILTGDSKNEAERIAKELEIDDVHYEVRPEQKAEIIQSYQMKGDYVIFVGDGINDSIALETADVGIAMASGTDIARESGDIILLNNDLRHIYFSKIIGEKTIAKIRQNIYWAIGYNSALIPVAAGILVPAFGLGVYSILPILAAFAMGMSSTSVVLNSIRLRKSIYKK